MKSNGDISRSAQFYEETGITRSFFSQVKNQEKYGRSYHFTPEHIKKIATIYGINTNWIFDLSKELYDQHRVKIRVNNG